MILLALHVLRVGSSGSIAPSDPLIGVARGLTSGEGAGPGEASCVVASLRRCVAALLCRRDSRLAQASSPRASHEGRVERVTMLPFCETNTSHLWASRPLPSPPDPGSVDPSSSRTGRPTRHWEAKAPWNQINMNCDSCGCMS